jgi:hypothetical protein
MSGIMNGVYYLRNSHNPSSRLPRQEVLTLLALLVQQKEQVLTPEAVGHAAVQANSNNGDRRNILR